MGILIALAVVLTLALIVVGVGYCIYLNIRGKLNSVARQAFGTETLSEGFEKANIEYAGTPKSISSGVSIYLPKIAKDFPDWNYDEMRERATNLLYSYIRAIDQKNVELLTEKTEELVENTILKIQALETKGHTAHYDHIHVHDTQLHRYLKAKGRCTVIFQSAVEYMYYLENNGKIIAGRKDLKTQARYNIEMVYIQDRAKVEDSRDFALGINCPNCGAPIENLGDKFCRYCGTGVVELNIHAWHFTKIDEA